TGNPFFPFMAQLFGGNGFSVRAVGFAELPKTLTHLFLLPWNLAFKVDVYGGEPIGCLFLAVLPVIPLTFKMKGLARTLLLFVILYTLTWYYSIQHARFFLPLLPFLSLLSAMGLVRWISKNEYFQKVLWFLTGILIFLHVGLAVYYPLRVLKGALGITAADAFLETHERSYAVMKRSAPHLKPSDKLLLLGEPRLFYAPIDAVHFNPTILFHMAKKERTFKRWLGEEKITHLLSGEKGDRAPAPLHWPEELKGDPSIPLITAEPVETYRMNVNDEVFTYTLWKITAAVPI
ncbi:MAG: hypothetical protein HY391_06550, partial [Deltaproteobacteria bacterium]|nr:hypothetical protein [Deltaproteobacteria bacterium]